MIKPKCNGSALDYLGKIFVIMCKIFVLICDLGFFSFEFCPRNHFPFARISLTGGVYSEFLFIFDQPFLIVTCFFSFVTDL